MNDSVDLIVSIRSTHSTLSMLTYPLALHALDILAENSYILSTLYAFEILLKNSYSWASATLDSAILSGNIC